MFQGLAENGVHADGIVEDPKKLLRLAVSSDARILHLHWIHSLATRSKRRRAAKRLLRFHTAILLWRLRRKTVVWTIHNLVNHEGKRAHLDRLNGRLVAREAHKIFVHGEGAIPLVRNEFRVSVRKISVIHHGNYEGVVGHTPARNPEHGLRFLFFGHVRPYKGILDLLRGFRALEGDHRLHIAGKPRSPELRSDVEKEWARDSSRVTLDLRFVPDQELDTLLAWCDVVVLPYRDILTSGSLLMAMSAGRPVIAPRSGLIPEYIDEQAAFLYDPSDPRGLVCALGHASWNRHELPEMAVASYTQSQGFRWTDICRHLAQEYQSV